MTAKRNATPTTSSRTSSAIPKAPVQSSGLSISAESSAAKEESCEESFATKQAFLRKNFPTFFALLDLRPLAKLDLGYVTPLEICRLAAEGTPAPVSMSFARPVEPAEKLAERGQTQPACACDFGWSGSHIAQRKAAGELPPEKGSA